MNGVLTPAPVSYTHLLHAALGRCIREVADTVHFQCAALDFQQIFLFALFHIKVDAGLPIGEFRLDIVAVSYTHLDVYKRQRQYRTIQSRLEPSEKA